MIGAVKSISLPWVSMYRFGWPTRQDGRVVCEFTATCSENTAMQGVPIKTRLADDASSARTPTVFADVVIHARAGSLWPRRPNDQRPAGPRRSLLPTHNQAYQLLYAPHGRQKLFLWEPCISPGSGDRAHRSHPCVWNHRGWVQ